MQGALLFGYFLLGSHMRFHIDFAACSGIDASRGRKHQGL